jgi:hypothetical protein
VVDLLAVGRVVAQRDSCALIARGYDAERLHDGFGDMVEDLPLCEFAAVPLRVALGPARALGFDDELDAVLSCHDVGASLRCE